MKNNAKLLKHLNFGSFEVLCQNVFLDMLMNLEYFNKI